MRKNVKLNLNNKINYFMKNIKKQIKIGHNFISKNSRIKLYQIMTLNEN